MKRQEILLLLTTILGVFFYSPNARAKLQLTPSIAILPFADYSYSRSLQDTAQRNRTILSVLETNFAKHGVQPEAQQNILSQLAALDIIKFSDVTPNNTASLQNELHNDWSETMKEQLRSFIQEQNIARFNPNTATPGSQALDSITLTSLGRRLNTDYILRGRILTTDNADWAPWYKTVLPFVSSPENHLSVGFAKSELYDLRPKSAFTSHQANLYGHANGDTVLWGQGPLNQGTRTWTTRTEMWLQRASDAQLIWSSTITVSITTNDITQDQTTMARYLEEAIQQGLSTLTSDLITQLEQGPTPAQHPGNIKLATDPDLLQRLHSLKQENLALRENHAPTNGKGIEKTSCWLNTSNKPEYLFNVTLTSQGIMVHGRLHPPRRQQELAQLPLSTIKRKLPLSSSSFRSQTRPIFDWSKESNCRFFVKVSDQTGPAEKALYKHYLRVVGEHFYTYEPVLPAM